MTHPSIERLLNSTKFWYLIKHNRSKYDERFREQIDIYKNADRKIFKSAAADKQRIAEATNGHSDPTKEIAPKRKEFDELFKDKSSDKLYDEYILFEKRSPTMKTGDVLFTYYLRKKDGGDL